MIEAYRNEILQTVCILSTGSTMFYLDARKYNSSKKLNMKQVSTISYTDADSLREALNSIADAENVFISTVVIVDTGSTADEISALHGLVLDYAFKVYVIPTLMARIVASFDLYFKEGQIDYNYNQKFRLLTCGNGIESTRLDRENGSAIFKIIKDMHHRGQNVADTLAHYSEADNTAILVLNNAEISGVPRRLKKNVIKVPNYEAMICRGGVLKALQIDRPDKFGARIPFVADFTDNVVALDRIGVLTLFNVGTALPCAKVFEVVNGSEVYIGPRFTLNPHVPPRTTTKLKFSAYHAVYMTIDEYGVSKIHVQ